MKITKYGSSTGLIESRCISILCDPWLIDGALYGAWCNFLPSDVDQIDFSKIDYLYISHVHPDHFDAKTMNLINQDIPVLIHSYHQKFLKKNIERLGFKTIELKNGQPYELGENVKFSIFAADNCDPSICGRMFGCVTGDIKGSMQLDSLCVIDDGEYVLVNTNDCPFKISCNALKTVKIFYPNIDFALVGYTSASLFPHCMMDYSNEEMSEGIQKAKMSGLQSGLSTLSVLKPKYYMPFAGTYIIGGSHYKKNMNLPLPEMTDAIQFFQNDDHISNANCQPILLNFNASFDLKTEKVSAPYIEICPVQRKVYIEKTASKFKYTFEAEPMVNNDELLKHFRDASLRLKQKQRELDKFEDINLIFDVNDKKFVHINLMNSNPKIVEDFSDLVNYHRFKLDPRLLNLSLKGPRFANWNNIESSGMLDFARKPDEYRMDVHILLSSLYV